MIGTSASNALSQGKAMAKFKFAALEDTWSLAEQLALARAVLLSGDQNWVNVAKQLKPLANQMDRPDDWFSHKNCAVQYNLLLEKVDKPVRRKRRHSGCDVNKSVEQMDSAEVQIVKRLEADRIVELKQIIEEESRSVAELEKYLALLQDPDLSDELLDDLEGSMKADLHDEERRSEEKEAWLAQREAKQKDLDAAMTCSAGRARPEAVNPCDTEVEAKKEGDHVALFQMQSIKVEEESSKDTPSHTEDVPTLCDAAKRELEPEVDDSCSISTEERSESGSVTGGGGVHRTARRHSDPLQRTALTGQFQQRAGKILTHLRQTGLASRLCKVDRHGAAQALLRPKTLREIQSDLDAHLIRHPLELQRQLLLLLNNLSMTDPKARGQMRRLYQTVSKMLHSAAASRTRHSLPDPPARRHR